MSTFVVTVALAICLAGVVILIRNRLGNNKTKTSTKSTSKQLPEVKSGTQYRSVKILPGLICCKRAQLLSSQVFLSRESPELPLPGCTETDCRCRYLHLEDRRSGGDRRVHLGELGAFLPTNQVERRNLVGRRAADMLA